MDNWSTALIRTKRLLPSCADLTSGVAGVLASGTAFAQNTTVAEVPGVSSGAMLQMLLWLAIIICLLFFGTYLLRKLNGGRSFGNNGPLKIVGGLMLSPRERIVLVEVGDEWVVVGVVPGQIKTLHTLPKGDLPTSGNNSISFSQWLKQISDRKNEHN